MDSDKSPSVRAFSWPAFLLPLVWPVAHRVPEVALGAWAIVVVSAVAGRWVALARPDQALAGQLVPLTGYLAAAVFAGFAGNRVLWRRHPDDVSVSEFGSKQVKWIRIGLVITAAQMVWLVALSFAANPDLPPGLHEDLSVWEHGYSQDEYVLVLLGDAWWSEVRHTVTAQPDTRFQIEGRSARLEEFEGWLSQSLDPVELDVEIGEGGVLRLVNVNPPVLDDTWYGPDDTEIGPVEGERP